MNIKLNLKKMTKETNMRLLSKNIVVALGLALVASTSMSGLSHAAFGESAAGTKTGQFLKLPVGAKAIGMGEAYTAVADDANAIYYNVAGIARLEKKSAEYMFSKYVEETSYHWVGFAMPISETIGSVGLGFQYFSEGELDQTNLNAQKTGTFSPHDLAVNLSYARQIFGAANTAGLTLKIINSKIEESASTVAIDLGVQNRQFLDGNLMLGFTVQNLGGSLKYESESNSLPILIKLGTGYKIKENWSAAADLVFPEDNSPTLALGTNYDYTIQDGMMISGRFGYNSRGRKVDGFNGITIGFGFAYQIGTLDYAWMPLGDLGATHRISFGVKF